MIWNKFLQLLLSIILTIYICNGIELSFIELIGADTLIIKKIQAKSAEFNWLFQVRQNSSTTNKKVYYHSVYDNFSTVYPRKSTIEDLKDELQLKAWDERSLNCGLFYNKTDNKYFIYGFPQVEGQSGKKLELTQQMTLNQGNVEQMSFKLGSTCDIVLINMLNLYIYNAYNEYNSETDNETTTYEWYLAGFFEGYDILGMDQNMYVIVTTQEVLFLNIQSVYYFQVNQQTSVKIEYRYDSYQYIYGTFVDLTSYKNSKAQVVIYSFPQSTYSQAHQRIVIIASKVNGSTFNYALVVIISSEDQGTNVIQTTTGQSIGEPQFVYSQFLTRAIVYGNSTAGDPFYEGYHFNYTEAEAFPIIFPSSISKYHNFLTINQYFLYSRNKNLPSSNKGNHSAFIFFKERLSSYFEQKVINQSQYNTNWVNAFIETPNYDAKLSYLNIQMTFYNLFSFGNKYYFKTDTAGSFSSMEAKQYTTFNEYSFTISLNSTESKSFISSSDTDFRWIYVIENKTAVSSTVYIETYNATTKNTTQASLTLNNKTRFFFQTYMLTPNLDCFYVENSAKSAIQFYNFDGLAIKYLADIVSDKFPASYPTSKDTNAQKNIQIASSCSVVRVLDKTYSLVNTTTPPTFKETPNSPLNLSKAVFDSSLMFAIQDTELYKYNGQTYEKILTSDFNLLNELISSSDGTKVMVRTSQKKEETVTNSTTNKTTTKTYFSFQLKVFHIITGLWNQIATDNKLTLNAKISSSISPLEASTNLDKAIFCYTKFDTTPKNECMFKIVDYTLNKAYESVYQLDSGKYPRTINFGDKFIYLVESEDSTIKKVTRLINCKEQTFAVVNNSVSLASSSEVECSLYEQGFYKRKVYESSADSSFSMVFEYLNLNKVSLVRTPSKTPDIIKSQLSLRGTNRGFFYQNGSFYQCTPGCLSCFNSYHCTKCVSGYSLSLENYKCLKCDGYCDSCNVANVTECYTCPLGFYFDKNKIICVKCNSKCETCTGRSETKCVTCKLGYFSNTNIQKKERKTCLSCPDLCDKCYNSTICTVCQYGYSFSTNGTCVKCPLDCNACDGNNVSNCISCRNGSELVTIDGRKQCKNCPSYCASCTNGVCSTPRTGYTLNTLKNVCYATCQSPCLECSLNSSSTCTSCMPGYKLSRTVCQVDISCNDNLTCIACPSEYVLIANKCYHCVLNFNCIECQSDDPTACASCSEGFYLINSYCVSCSSDCVRCYAASICQECKDGFMLSWTDQNGSICVACSSLCKTCIQSSTNCESCFDGFQLVGSTCVSYNILTFILKINLDIANFSTTIYSQIIEQLASVTSKATSAVAITSIKNGSVVISGSINVNNTADQSATISALDSVLGPGSTIAGLQIQQSQFVGYSPAAAVVKTSSSNMVLILATVIPGAIIIVGLLVLFIYKKFFALEQLDSVRQQSDRSSETDISEKVEKKQSTNKQEKKSKNGFMPKIKRKLPTQIK